MKNKTMTAENRTALVGNQSKTTEEVRAINIKPLKNGFRVYYENGQTMDFAYEYMNRTAQELENDN